MLQFFCHYFRSQDAATAVEYGLIAAGISLAIVASVFVFGDGLQLLYETMIPALDAIPDEVETSR